MKTRRQVVILMGVSGSGKSVVATEVSRRLEVPMLDGDFLHPRANVRKMAAGEPLNDADREPWLERMNDAIFAMSRTHENALLVCSALKRKYRERLREGNPDLKWIYLRGGYDLIEERLKKRKGHFLKPEMLRSQFDALEEPGEDEADVLVVSIEPTLGKVVETVIEAIADHSAEESHEG